MTPTQLRAFAAVVRLGSVKRAAADLDVSEAAVSIHVGQLRKELGDRLFTRTAVGLAFTPGGLRLASRAGELLGLQDRTILEVSQAGAGRRLLRVAASSMFAEHCAPGLIELFAGRAADLDVELSVHSPQAFDMLLRTRAVDVALGPCQAGIDASIVTTPFLNYELAVVAAPEHPMSRVQAGLSELREQTWLLGPSATDQVGLAHTMLQRIGVAEDHQQIFQSHGAALEQAKRGNGIALGVSFVVARDVMDGKLKRIAVPALQARGSWHILALDSSAAPPAAAELMRFVTTPRATQAMLRGAGVTVGRFRPSIHVTLWN